MKKIFTRILSVLVSAVLSLSIVGTDAYARDGDACLIPIDQTEQWDFQDLQQSWCSDYVRVCCQAGLLKGKTADRFDEKGLLTNAQITVITARLYEKLTKNSCDLTAKNDEPWYAASYALLKRVMPDVMEREMYLDAPFMRDISDDPCSREAFAEMIAGVLCAAEVTLPVKNEIGAIPDTTSPHVQMLYQAGVLAGTDQYGFFHGSASLTRGQAAAMLARLVDADARMDVKLEPFDFFGQVLGVSADTVLFSVGEEVITADACGSALCMSLLREVMANGRAPSAAMETVAADYCRRIAAPLALADDLGISLTQKELDDALLSAQTASGYMGRSAESWYRENCRDRLAEKVARYYADHAAPDWDYDATVKAKCDALQVEETPALRALDAEHIYFQYIRLFL